jgi:hypothetical protein
MSYEWKHCPTCGNYGRTDKHHIYPQCYFNGKGPTINICHDCHQGGIEQLMPDKRLTKDDYKELFICFIELQAVIYKINIDQVVKEAGLRRAYESSKPRRRIA